MSSSIPPETKPVPSVEPWMSGSHAEVPAVGRAVLHALDLALDDLTKWTAGLSDAETHAWPLGLPSVAFHLKHIARSADRLLTYAEGGQLSQDRSDRARDLSVCPGVLGGKFCTERSGTPGVHSADAKFPSYRFRSGTFRTYRFAGQ